MSELSDISDRLEAAADKAENGSQIIHDFANGDKNTLVKTESGDIPTLAKLADDFGSAKSVTPAADKVPQAGVDGKIDEGWLPASVARASDFASSDPAKGAALVSFQMTKLDLMLKDIHSIRAMGGSGVSSQDVSDYLQAMVDSSTQRPEEPVTVYLPAGDWKVTRPIVSGSRPVIIRGVGPYASRILCSHTGDLFQHGLSSIVAGAHFELHDVGLYITVAGSTGNAINIRQNPATGRFVMDNTFVGSFSANFNWGRFVLGEGTTRVRWTNAHFDGGSYGDVSVLPASTQIGCLFRSDDNTEKSFEFNFYNVHISAVVNAVRVEVNGAPGNSGSVEGMVFRNCNGRTVAGPWFKMASPNSATAWHPPYFVFDGCNFEGPGTIVDVEACSEFHMHDCLHYMQSANSASGAVTDMVRLNEVQRAFINDNSFTLYSGAKVNNVLYVGPSCLAVSMRNNNFVLPSGGGVTLLGGICVAAAEAEYNVSGNRFINWPAGIPKEWTGVASSSLNAKLEISSAGQVQLRSNGSTAFAAANDVSGNTSSLLAKGGVGSVSLSVSGITADMSIYYDAVGLGEHRFRSRAQKDILSLIASATAVNYVQLNSSGSGFGPLFAAVGSDTNIPIRLKGKGTGAVSLESAAMLTAVTFASLPAAGSNNGVTYRVSDRANRFATSDGTNWRWQDGAVAT